MSREARLVREITARCLGSNRHRPELRELLHRQDYRCAYCGTHLEIGVNASVDHIVPRARGGEDVIQNLQWVDLDCNYMKRALLEPEFLDRIAAIYHHRLSRA